MKISRRLPVGAEVMPEGGVHFRVWAPRRTGVSLVLENGPGLKPSVLHSEKQMEAETGGYFSLFLPDAGVKTLYRFRCEGEEMLCPDPASRFQPDGPLGPSAVVDPLSFSWTDEEWRGISLEGQIIYEMHTGTFTGEGTWEAAGRHLPELAELGITVVEVMPVADFAGRFGWGYDGVNMYAPTRLYGSPDDFRDFVNKAHELKIGVILDVVYNHLGPMGNFLKSFSLDYFTDRYKTDWGEAINFDGKNSGPVREFYIFNAGYWIDEFHLDGLRIDATDAIIDRSPVHVVSEIAEHARKSAGKRSIIIIAENESQDVRLIRTVSDGGFGLDAVWNDDFHHTAMVALTGRKEAYYSDYLGTPQEFISAAKWGYLYQGQHYSWQKKRRGTLTYAIRPEKFINYIQNHDQVANSARSLRCHFLTSPSRYRAMTALLLLSPQTPMLFQGQEFCSSSPFCYFADIGELAEEIRKGRAEFLGQFKSFQDPEIKDHLSDPTDSRTFERSKLDWSELKQNSECYALYRDLLRLRRLDAVFRSQRNDWLHGAVLGTEAFVLRFFGKESGDRLLLVNFGRELRLREAPEPLLAPPEDSIWEVLWSSESPRYGGNGTPETESDEGWRIPGNSTIVLAPKKIVMIYRAENHFKGP